MAVSNSTEYIGVIYKRSDSEVRFYRYLLKAVSCRIPELTLAGIAPGGVGFVAAPHSAIEFSCCL